MIRSKTLNWAGRTLIGLKLYFNVESSALKIGDTSANFNLSGNLLSDGGNSDDGVEIMQKQDGAKQHNSENENISNENDGNNEDENEDESNTNCARTRSGRIVKRPKYLKDYI